MTNLELVEKLKPVAKELTPHGDYLVDTAFSSYQRELEELRKEQEVEVQIYPGNRGDCIIHKVLDNMYIVEYGKKSMNSEHEMYAPYRDGVLSHEVWPSFDEALLALVTMKTKSESAIPYIVKMLGLDNGGENNA